MGDDDMIRRGDAIAKCRAMADEAKSYGMPQMAMGGYASAEAIAAIPAADARPVQDDAASRRRKLLGHMDDKAATDARAEAERDALRERVARLEGALRHYRETLCEGFCGEDMWADEGHSHPEIQRDCGGCLAASVLLSAALTDGGKDE